MLLHNSNMREKIYATRPNLQISPIPPIIIIVQQKVEQAKTFY